MTAAILHPAPMIGTFHAAGDSTSYKLLNPFVRWVAGNLELRCAVSPDAAALAERYLGGRYDLLFNGIELERYQAGQPLKPSGPTVFFCGRHEPRKGLEILLEAMRELPAEVRLWVASDGPDTARLQAAYAGDPRVEWLGRLSEAEKIARLQGATVYCAPALGGESFGVVLLEAMAAGTPVVASDIPGYRNVAAPGGDALMVPPGDPSALAAALGRVLADEALAEYLRAAGTQRARSFSMSKLADLYLARYERLVAEAAASRPGRGEGRLARRMRGSWVRR
jgi:phosphatidylinositol alpha-mannosyltransferase